VNPASVSDTIVEEIAIKGVVERVFEALTSPGQMLKWWRSEGRFQATHVESDLRPGGKWMMRVTCGPGKPNVVSGEYRRIERPRLLVFTWIRGGPDEDPAETIVRFDLEEQAGVTTVRVTHSGLATEQLRQRNDGWPLILTLLHAYVEEQV